MSNHEVVENVLGAVQGTPPDTICSVVWGAERGGADVAIFTIDAYRAWLKSPSTPPPRILWWSHFDHKGDGHDVCDKLWTAGIVWLGAPHDDRLRRLREHVLRPVPRECSHCGAQVAGNVSVCKFCNSPV